MQLKQILAQTSFRFNKKFGQNFIEDDAILSSIVSCAAIEGTDTVLEIGVGAGTLTRALAKRAKFVCGYEIDRSLAPVLSRTLSGVDNAEVVFRDFMRADLADIERTLGTYVVVANLPYYITTPIVMRLIEEATNCKRIVIMVQKEVAERFCAKAGTAEYGAITPAIDVVADASIVMEVGRENFYPVPNVDSAVVRIDINPQKYPSVDRKAFRDVVRAAFSSRRKTLVNNLANSFRIDKSVAGEIVLSLCGDINIRGEALTTAQFARLTSLLSQYL